MSNAVRVALAVFAVGALGVWLVKPIGDACPDVGKLPAGSESSSSPSLAPPLTRTCTYTTADGTEAHKRYVPFVDWLILAVVAGVAGTGVGLAGPGTPTTERAPKPERGPRPEREPRSARTPKLPRVPRTERDAAPEPAPVPAPDESADDRAGQREREREERARRRARG